MDGKWGFIVDCYLIFIVFFIVGDYPNETLSDI